MVQILGGSFAGMDLVFHAVQTCHQQSGKAQVRVHQWIGEAGFHATALGVRHKRDTDRGGTVLGRISQFHRCFEMGNQTLVAVGAGVGDGVQGTGVLDDAADVVQREVRQTGIAVAGKQVFAVFPHGLVHVHAGTVVAVVRLGHESGGLAIGIGHIVDHIFLQNGPVSALHQGAETGADFVLASARHFVVEHFNRNAQRFENQGHFSAHVLRAVNGRHWEVTTFDRGTVTTVAAFELGARVPGCFVFVNLVEGVVGFSAPTHAVKNEKFWLGAEECGITNTGGLEVGFRALGNGAGITVIGLAVAGLHHVTGDDDGGFFEEGVDVGGVGIGHEQHVRSFNALPARDRRAVKGMARRELVFIKMGYRHRGVLLFAAGIGETEVNKFDFVLFHHLHHVCDGLGHQILLLHGC